MREQGACLPEHEVLSKEHHGVVAKTLQEGHRLKIGNRYIRLDAVVDHVAEALHEKNNRADGAEVDQWTVK